MKFEYKKDCCSFCDPQRDFNTYWMGGVYDQEITGYDDEGYYINEDNGLCAIPDDPYCGTGILKVNYCPICGRCLKKETDNA